MAKANTDAEETPQEFNVVENRPRGRVLYTGSESGAQKFVEANFPRVHVNPGSIIGDGPVADVHVVSPDGTRRHYLGQNDENDGWENVNGDESGNERESYA